MSEEVLRGVMDQWKAGIDAHEPQRVAALFAEDAIFQGLRPYSVGRQAVHDYYDSQPRGMTVSYRILQSRRIAEDTVLGYLNADFTFPDPPNLSVRIGVLMTSADDGWQIRFYQASVFG
ncbi:hypothetical protein BST27_25605 [Mycobacterium intermedium]|uniref:SnoaL-like domain-containing protein n=1 Tax=Mycobacterium intermedium TaxID=28445 RepID=A0A1E3S6H9_MYCIE|nr:SgcJ/EcaC family oxidoreductase [Mycobacterium intermedium]MCV6966916.1 SgcJ/EcaC family oxidoreductase [Mycobacterium intermedium]ODQ97252.1 hypothetical protein BHQ20_27115 [Mycobacterium intermedium]OPE47423.1 hypothetical protein BV508_22180 [Mycobacterium intermedium]ORA96452.1 hypothetical protein BST27_25605 [Mycobacterium intermedium]